MSGFNFLMNISGPITVLGFFCLFVYLFCFFNVIGNRCDTEAGSEEAGKPLALVFQIRFLC